MVSSGLHTSTIACWADLDVCLLYGNFGGKSKTQTVGGNINHLLGSLVFTVPDLHISSWLFLYSLYRISPRDCCFVTFCTIVLAGFVLHRVLKKIPHYSLPFFFFHVYSFPHKLHIEACHPALRDLAALNAVHSLPSAVFLLTA